MAYSLQLHRAFHNPPFATKAIAEDYINNNIISNVLEGEPFLVSYGDTSDPKIILGIGNGQGGYTSIDTTALQSEIDEKVDKINSGILVADIFIADVNDTSIEIDITYRDTTDGTENTVHTFILNGASSTQSGLMTATDKIKLDDLPDASTLEDMLNDLSNSKIDKSGITGQLQGVVNDELVIIPKEIKDIYVNSSSTQTILPPDGSIFFPYTNLQNAINTSISGQSYTIHIDSGYYNASDATISINDITNLTVLSQAANGQYRSQISGGLTIGGTSEDIGIKGIEIKGDLMLSTSNGAVYFDNVRINTLNTSTSNTKKIIINGTGYYQFYNCEFMGNLSILDSNPVEVFIEGGSNELGSIITVNNPNAILILKDLTNVTLNLISGNVIVEGSTNFITSPYLPDSSGINKCIIANGNGYLALMDGTAQDPNTLAYFPISVASTVKYSLGTFQFDPTLAVLNGLLVEDGLHSLQIYDHNTRSSYTPTKFSLDGHLDGISNALTGINTNLSSKLDITNISTNPDNTILTQGFNYNTGTSTTQYTSLPSGKLVSMKTGYDVINRIGVTTPEPYIELSINGGGTNTNIMVASDGAYLTVNESLIYDNAHKVATQADIQTIGNGLFIKQSTVPPVNTEQTLMQSVSINTLSDSSATLSQWSVDVVNGGSLIETQIPIPIVTTTLTGLMPASDHNQIINNTIDIQSLKGSNIRVPTLTALPANIDQTLLTPLWNSLTNSKPLVDGDTLISLNSNTMNYTWTWFNIDNSWHYRGIDTVGIATTITVGVVIGSTANGKIFVESDGSMSLNGYDDIITSINSLTLSSTNYGNRITALETLTTNQSTLITTLQGNLNQEITDRTNADTVLQTNIDTVQDNLTTEQNRAIAAELILTNNVTNHESRINTLEASDTSQNANINQLQTELTNEINTRSSESIVYNNRITTLENEVSTLQTQVSTLQTQVSTLQTQVIVSGSFIAGGNGTPDVIRLIKSDNTTINIDLTGLTNHGTF